MRTNEACSPLLSMPQLPFFAVLQSLNSNDKMSLASTCQSLAKVVSEASGGIGLTITSATGWKGLSRVLATRTITCKTMVIQGRTTISKHKPGCFTCWRTRRYTETVSAIDVLLGPHTALGCSFPGIQKVYLKAQPLHCILPVRLAALLPDMEELDIRCDAQMFTKDADLQPIPYCSMLRKIRFGQCAPHLPSKYHTSEDLRRQLPNVVSLDIQLIPSHLDDMNIGKAKRFVSTVLNAWRGQLTEVVLDTDLAPSQLFQCTSLQLLRWQRYNSDIFASVLPPSLTKLELRDTITESNLQAILQLPVLCVFIFQRFHGDLQHDWSEHPCSWRALKVSGLSMAHLSKLPLHSLAEQGCINISELFLPDPLFPDSLSKVQHAAQCVTSAGITIEGLHTIIWDCHNVKEGTELSCKADTQLAPMLCAACKVVLPPQSYYFKNSHDIPSYPQATQALFHWLGPTLRELRMSEHAKLPSWFWVELGCCTNLVEISMQLPLDIHNTNDLRTPMIATRAAQFYVASTQRPITLVFQDRYNVSEKPGWASKLTLDFKYKVQEQLPPSVILEHWALHPFYRWLIIQLQPRQLRHASTSSTSVTQQQA